MTSRRGFKGSLQGQLGKRGLQAQLGGEDSSESESDSEQSSEEIFKQELADIPLGELQEIRQKVGTKKFDSVLQRASEGKAVREERSDFKRENKNRPREMSSKKPVSRYREVIHVKKLEVKDPRFDDRAGSFNDDLFKKSYAFLEDVKKEEKKLIQKEVRKTKSAERKEQLHRLLQQMESQEAAQKKLEERRALLREHKKAERQLQTQGRVKKPFFLKKSMQKRLELAQKYKELQKSGKLEKFLSKKRKKNASRDRKRMPFKRKP